MSQYYNPNRTTNIFNANSNTPFNMSRSKIELFKSCPRCFYLDCCYGVARPPGYPFTLNNAVDTLLKKEFDTHRIAQSKHPLIEEYNIDAIPFKHKDIDAWRNRWQGIQYIHEPTNLLVKGIIDDIWINSKKELMIVDYKATSKNAEVTLDAEWQISYKRQVEVYQWLFRKNDFKISDIAYFVYCNGDSSKKAFDKKIEFDIKVIPYKGDDSWIEQTLLDIHKCLSADKAPEMNENCDYCRYRKQAAIKSAQEMKKAK